MQSLFKKQFLMTAGILLASFFLMALVMMVATYNYFVERAQSQLKTTAEAAANLTSAYSGAGNLSTDWGLRMSISLCAQVSETNILICNNSGEAVISSDINIFSDLVGKSVPAPAMQTVGQTGSYTSFGTFGGLFGDTRYIYGSPIYTESGRITGVVFASSSAEDVIGLFLKLIYIFLIVTILILLITLIFTGFTASRQVKPLRDMADAARLFGRGDYSTRAAQNYQKDEIGELARAFNSMAESIERSEKLRQEFVENISHELRTPMTTIAGFVDGVLDGTIPKNMQEGCLRTVSAEVRRLSRLVVRMLDISRMQARLSSPAQALHKESFDVSEVLRITLLGMEKNINDKGLDVDASLGEEEVLVFGEKDSILQVIYNLLGNAVKFAETGSAIALSLRKNGDKAVISFSNHGRTIPPEELEAIFNRFHKADASRSEDKEGLGLGLYIVKSIISAHGEDILVTSKDGLTTFTITLTLAKETRNK